MIHINKRWHSVITAILYNGMVKLSSFCKLSYILGSWAAFFNASVILLPLSGAWFGVPGVIAIFGIRVLSHSLVAKSLLLPFHLFAFYIPGLFAGLYWAQRHWMVRLMPAVVCIIVFLAHPTGAAAAVYTVPWFVPVIAFWYRNDNLLLTALGSTFTAHAIGSVIWLYTTSMPATAWTMLTPVACIERLIFAGMMVVVYKAVSYLTQSSFVSRVSSFVTSGISTR